MTDVPIEHVQHKNQARGRSRLSLVKFESFISYFWSTGGYWNFDKPPQQRMKLTPEYVSICIKKILKTSLIDFSTKDSFLNQRLIYSSGSNETNPNLFVFHVRYNHQQDSDQIFERFTLQYSLIPKNPSIQRFFLP